MSVALELGLIGFAILLYFGVRGLTQGNEAEAVRNGFGLLRFEQTLGLDLEASIQNGILDYHWLVTAANWIYIWGHWPLIATTLIWLHRTQKDSYIQLRNAMFISGAIGLVIFTLYPVAPPRLLDNGMVDTVTNLSNSYRVLQPPSLVNKYAALPSLHVGWNLLVGIAVFRAADRRTLRIFGILSPIAMAAAVVLTANHYLVDGLVGATVALTGWYLATQISNRNAPTLDPQLSSPKASSTPL